MFDFYKKETFPPHIRFVKDTDYNIKFLTEKLGPSKVPLQKNRCFLEVDIENKTWFRTFTFAWLYRNSPPLSTVGKLGL